MQSQTEWHTKTNAGRACGVCGMPVRRGVQHRALRALESRYGGAYVKKVSINFGQLREFVETDFDGKPLNRRR